MINSLNVGIETNKVITVLLKESVDLSFDIFIIFYLFLFHSAWSIELQQCLAIQGSCFSFLDPLDIW
jgi:hypothetical protein